MNKIILLGCVLFFYMGNASAQDEDVKKTAASGIVTTNLKKAGWVKGGFFGLNISNTTFSNWSGGGTSNTAGIASANLFAIYRPDTITSIWENYLELAAGLIRNGPDKVNDPASPYYGKTNPFVKNEDKLVFVSKYGRTINKKMNAACLLSLNTQMFPGYAKNDIFRQDNHISNFMAQGFGYIGLGLDYKPVDYLSIYVSPVTAKYTAVIEQRIADLGSYGVAPAEYDYSDTLGGKAPVKTKNGERLRTEFGWYVNIFFKKDIAKNVNLQSRLELFNNYKNFGQNIDVNLQTTLNLKVNKMLSVSLINQILYDYDVDTDSEKTGDQIKVQMKNFFGVSFSVQFGDKL